MKGRKIVVLMALMVLTLAGLVIFQVRMIHSVYGLEHELFEQSANQAIHMSIRFLEEKQTMLYVSEAIALDYPELKDEIDSLRSSIHYVPPYEREKNGHGDSSVDRTIAIIKQQITDHPDQIRLLVDNAVYKWISDEEDRDLRDRIDFNELYEVLGNHLLMCGIDDPYEYCVYDHEGRLVYCSPLVQSEQRLRRPILEFSQPLFPTSLNGGQASLKVIFPTLKNEKYASSRATAPSIILLLLILFIFIYTVVIIYHQRNIDQIKTDFINNMTHEFKTPIASISLAAQMFQDPNVSNSPQRTFSLAKIIREESNRLQMLIEKVLQTAVYEKGTTQLKMTDLSVNQLIDNVCNMFSINIEHAGGQLVRQLGAQSDIALVDQLHFSNIIYNLLDNALKYRSDKRSLIVYIRTYNKDNQLYIEIEDNGIGISRHDQKHIFDQFFRVHTGDRHDVRGYGIGLAYVKRMVDDHHAQISVQSEPNVGTCFTISIPTL